MRRRAPALDTRASADNNEEGGNVTGGLVAGSPGGTASGGEIRNSAGIESSRSNKVFRLDLLSELYLLSDFVADRLDDDSFKRDSGLRLDPGTPLALLSECFGLPKAAYTKFMAIQADDREDLVRRVARYSVLTYCSGSSGVIEEASIIKDALGGRSDAHPRLLLLAAAPLLRRTLAIEPVQVLKAPIKEDFEYANKGHVPTKLAPAWVLRRTIGDEGGPHVADVCSRNAAVASASVDGLTAAQRGLLGVVLCLLLLEPAKALREDRLWHLLQQLDSERFALGENKADVVRMGEAAAEAEACRPGAGLHPAADGAGTRTAASAPLDRSLLDWRTVISRDFVRLGYLWRRSAESEGLFEETDDLSAPPGSKTEAQGDRKTAYRLGPRARHTVGAPALLSVIEQLSGASYTKDEVRANLGVEWAGVDVAASAAGDFFDAKQRAADDARHKRMRAFEQPSVEGEQPGSTAGGPRKSRR